MGCGGWLVDSASASQARFNVEQSAEGASPDDRLTLDPSVLDFLQSWCSSAAARSGGRECKQLLERPALPLHVPQPLGGEHNV